MNDILYLPPAGSRYYSTAKVSSSSSYWSSSPVYSDSAYYTSIGTSPYYYLQFFSDYRGYGRPVRCFKNEYTPPVSISCAEAQDITYNGITIMACNLGATELYNGVNSTNSCGNYYQRGNNYPMGDGKLTGEYLPNSTTRVNASSF